MPKNYLSPNKEIIKEARKMFILVDDKDRENEKISYSSF